MALFLAALLGVAFLAADLGVLAAGFLPVLAAFLVADFFTCRATGGQGKDSTSSWSATAPVGFVSTEACNVTFSSRWLDEHDVDGDIVAAGWKEDVPEWCFDQVHGRC